MDWKDKIRNSDLGKARPAFAEKLIREAELSLEARRRNDEFVPFNPLSQGA